MLRLWFVPLLCLLFSCVRSGGGEEASVQTAARPAAILQAGEYPLWFQLTDAGPVLLESIEDASASAALIPWPLALHIRFVLARGNEILLAVNRDGFISLAPWQGPASQGATSQGGVFPGLGLYYIPGGKYWQPYTVGAFVFVDDRPAALLYLDDRFLDSRAELPRPRLWTFTAESAEPEGLDIPALDRFPPQEGWDADALRHSADGYWYYRVIKKEAVPPEVLFFCAEDLAGEGREVSLGSFQNSALPEPLEAAPEPLRSVLAAFDDGIALAVSPDFQAQRYFIAGSGSTINILAYYQHDRSLALAIQPDGQGVYTADADPDTAASAPGPLSLPLLPEGFVYTSIALSGDTLFAAWEEQVDFSIGAAGFMVIKR